MSLKEKSVSDTRERAPRVSGDEPDRPELVGTGQTCSPRERG